MDTRDIPPNPYLIGCDLGQALDYTAIVVAEQLPGISTDKARYQIPFLERWHPHRYGDVITRVATIVQKLRAPVHVVGDDGRYETMRAPVTLVVDRTGVGRAVGDQFTDAALDVDLQLVTITGGDSVTKDGESLRVPKRDLAGVVAVLLQSSRLEITKDSPHSETLRSELRNFRVKISASGHDSYGAGDDWRENAHDDLVLATALALWAGEQSYGHTFSTLEADTVAWLEQAFGGEPAGAGRLHWRS